MMKKQELIAALSGIPDDAEILVEGYETGFDRIIAIQPVEVAFVRNAKDWDGEYIKTFDVESKNRYRAGIHKPPLNTDNPIMAVAFRGNRR